MSAQGKIAGMKLLNKADVEEQLYKMCAAAAPCRGTRRSGGKASGLTRIVGWKLLQTKFQLHNRSCCIVQCHDDLGDEDHSLAGMPLGREGEE